MKIKKIICIIIILETVNSYILPQTFREWTIIGIEKEINKKKPYHYKIGELPMVLWYNKTKPQTIINNCNKHLGNTLKESYIKNNNLICPYHNSSYNNEDNLGKIEERNGILWWSYKSFKKEPPKLKDENNNNYIFKVNSDLISIILNIICEFNGEEETIRYVNKKLLIKNKKNYLLYKYPYTIILNNNYMINIIPIDINKSYIYLTTKKGKEIKKDEIKRLKENIERRFNELKFKYFLLKTNNSYIYKIYENYKDYMYINDFTINHFLLNKNYY